MLKLILVRHGETPWNEARRVQGSGSDTELSEKGRLQAQCLARALRGEPVAAVYSSPLRRARQTAEAIAAVSGLRVALEPDLREIAAGDLEGRPLEGLGGALGRFMVPGEDGSIPHLPGGEGLEELQVRAWGAVREIIAAHRSGRVVAVSHYFAILTIICGALGFPLATARRLRVAPGSLNIIGFASTGPLLLALNDTCHLPPEAS